ncbi:MAG: hypothetical protein KAQ89_00770 [Planctomycetes bacterium]|nr:hypothetical protein [Planctomycetota bacterium]
MKAKLFYTWLIPTIWIPVTIISFFNSGDEHGCLAIGTFPFVWPLYYFFNFNGLTTYLLFAILLLGAVVLASLGLAMDYLRVSRKLVLAIFTVCFILFLWIALKDFESLQAVRWKHRSILAPLSAISNVSLYIAISFSIIGVSIFRFIKSLKNKKQCGN